MTPNELVILLPCHSLEDFPHELGSADAQGLLAAWSALWHPRLLAAAGKTPRWYRADCPPDEVAGRLIVIPDISQRQLPTGWTERAGQQGAVLIQHEPDRSAIVALALAALDDPRPIDDTELVADFLALGFAYLVLELLTRQMRYISNLDEVYLESQALAAGRAATEGDFGEARERLHSTFGVLMEGRERFYPVDSYLLDLTFVAPTTLGASLRSELSAGTPINVVISAATLEQMEREEPETLAALSAALERGAVSLIGGEYREAPLPLMSAEAIRDELARGAEVYQRIAGRSPKVFGRRTAGLVPSLPQILSRLGFTGAIHATLDEGKLPRTEQSKAGWQGWDNSSIDAFARVPLDAREAATFISLPAKLGETMDLDHVATLALAHWPGDASQWYGDLRRIHRFVPLFGKFVTAEDFFSQTDTVSRFSKTTPDDYQTPYLSQAVRAGADDPISVHVRRQRGDVRRMMDSGLALLRSALCLDASGEDFPGTGQGEAPPDAAQAVAAALALGGDASRTGTILVNPFSFPCSAGSNQPAMDHAAAGRAVDVPAMGFVWLDPHAPPTPAAGKKTSRPIVSERVLANEHFEIHIHPETGGIEALRNDRARGNRLSQQLALRCDDGATGTSRSAGEPVYSTMRANSIEVETNNPAVGQVVSRGRLLGSDERELARFEQVVRVARGSRIAELSIRLELEKELAAAPWRSYYACRWAWATEDAELRRSVTGTSQPTTAQRIEAPHFVEIRDHRSRTALLMGGLPYHVRSGDRMLDTLLVVRGERQRQFSLGIGVELPCAESAALVVLGAGPLAVPGLPSPPGHPSGWLFWFDAARLVATHWEPIRRPAGEGADTSRAVGFRVRILETEGKPGRARLHAFRPIGAARQVDLLGQPLAELRLIDDAVSFDFGAYEWLELEVEWRA